MSNPILDDSSDYWKTIITSNKIIAGIIILLGMFFIYAGISEWYSIHYLRVLVSFPQPEILHPIRILASIITCFYGLGLFFEKMKARTAILLSIFTLFGVNLATLLLF